MTDVYKALALVSQKGIKMDFIFSYFWRLGGQDGGTDIWGGSPCMVLTLKDTRRNKGTDTNLLCADDKSHRGGLTPHNLILHTLKTQAPGQERWLCG